MTLVFALCVAWATENGACSAVAWARAESPHWSDAPCDELVPDNLRRVLVHCVRIRGVAL